LAREPIVQSPVPEDPKQRDAALRPRWLREVIGQKAVVQRLGIALNACKKLKEPMAHTLFDGPPGLGKTTFATVLPNELGTTIQMTSGPALSKPADMLPFLTNLEEGSILFIDEIHRMPRVVEEFIYPAMEDFRIDIVLGDAGLMRESPGVVRVCEHDRGCLGNAFRAAVHQPRRLHTRSRIAFDAVRAAADHQHARRIAAADDCHIQKQLLVLWAARPRMAGMIEVRAGCARRVEKAPARIGVRIGEHGTAGLHDAKL
jgi:hypothetical protein